MILLQNVTTASSFTAFRKLLKAYLFSLSFLQSLFAPILRLGITCTANTAIIASAVSCIIFTVLEDGTIAQQRSIGLMLF